MNAEFSACDDINGLEFDWYAVDLSGQYALFSTAGSGHVPKCLHSCLDEYSDVSVPAASTGENPWKPLAKAGFFVFDMFNSEAYEKKADASGPLKPHHLKTLQALPNLLQFNGYFEQTRVIHDGSLFSLKAVEFKSTSPTLKV